MIQRNAFLNFEITGEWAEPKCFKYIFQASSGSVYTILNGLNKLKKASKDILA